MAAENMEGKNGMDLLAMGTRAYWTRNYANAATYLSRSSELLVEEHKDDKHNTLGNVYLYYGKALLELAREDGDPLGDAVPKDVAVEEDLSDEEEANEEGEDGADKEGGADKKEGASEEKKENKTPTKKDAADDEKVAKSADISINGEAATSSADDSKMDEENDEGDEEDEGSNEEADAGEGGSAEKEDEEPTDLQLAWEVLELAKIILERRGDEGKEDFADCLVTLGEVSLESENFDSAIADITSGLAIQKDLFKESKDMRKLAETYYKLGMALSAHNKIEDGIENYLKTQEILKERLKVLEAKETPGSSDVEEIRDIKNLVPELDDKVADLRSFKDEVNNKEEEEPPVVSSPEKKANNISHLVKRKRKLEDIAEDAATNAAKKAAP